MHSIDQTIIHQDLLPLCEQILGSKLVALELVPSGMNSQSFIASTESKQRYFIKRYPIYEGDLRPRLENEWRALKYFEENDIHSTPKPIHYDKANGLIVMECIEGRRLDPKKITSHDIVNAVDFLIDINATSDAGMKNLEFDKASEACFSLDEYKTLFSFRITKLEKVAHPLLSPWLQDVYKPFLKSFWELFTSKEDYFVPKEVRVLSPSDVGFHNILKDCNGGLRFIDFEYFGWDDPVKMICDFVLEPEIPLDGDLKRDAIAYYSSKTNWSEAHIKRYNFLFPLCGLKWCLIILNSFLGGRVAVQSTRDLENQLEKANNMLKFVVSSLSNKEYQTYCGGKIQ